MDSGSYRYWAFISYSHRDKAWGDWLHRALEDYRVPSRLVGKPGRDGPLPKRLFPVFRDREELPSSADLSRNIEDALRQSRYLLVICSPAAAASRWVNEEIIAYKRMGRADRILALVVDGEPNASDHPESGQAECFPPALRNKLGADGAVLPERVEPIAADARPDKDGRANARLKLLAGLLGLPYDELRQRERQRRLRRRLQWATAAILAMLLSTGVWHWQSRRTLAASYAEQGRQALLSGNASAAAAYLGAAYGLGDTDPTLRFMLARALAPLQTPVHSWKSRDALLLAGFDPDGGRVLGVTRSTIVQWDSSSGVESARIPLDTPAPQHAGFSPRSHLAAVGYADGSIDVYDLRAGRRVARLHATAAIEALGFDAGETRLLSRDEGVKVDIFDLARQARLASFKTPAALSQTAEFSRDGSRVLTCSDDGKVRLWDAASGRNLLTLASEYFDRAGFDREQPLIRTRNGRHVELWDFSGRLKGVLPGPSYTLNVLTGIPAVWSLDNGRHYLMADDDGTVTLVDGSTGSASLLPLLADKPLLDVASTASGFRVLVREATGVLAVRDPYTALPLAETLQPLPQPRGLSFDAGGTRVLVYDAGSVMVWDTQASRRPVTFAANEDWEEMTRGQWSPDGTRLALVAPDGALALYDFSSEQMAWRSASCPEVSAFPVFDHAGTRLAASCRGTAWSLVDAKTGQALHPLASSMFKPWQVAFSADDRHLLYQGDHLEVVDLTDWSRYAPPADRTGSALAAFTPDAHGIAVFSTEARFYDLGTQRLLSAQPWHGGGVEAQSLSPDGHLLTLLHSDGALEQWDLAARRGRVLLKVPTGFINEGAVSTDGSRILVVDEHGARVLDGASGALVATLEQRAGEATLHERSRVADVDEWDPVTDFSPDGRFLLAAAGNGLGVWDSRDGRLLVLLGRFPGLISSAAFSPNGAHAGASDEATLRVWDTGIEARSPAEVQLWLACHVPWRVEAGELRPTEPDRAACPAQ